MTLEEALLIADYGGDHKAAAVVLAEEVRRLTASAIDKEILQDIRLQIGELRSIMEKMDAELAKLQRRRATVSRRLRVIDAMLDPDTDDDTKIAWSILMR